MGKNRSAFWAKFFSYLVLGLIAALILIPLLWGVLNSFKTNDEFFKNSLALPKEWMFSNYATAWQSGISDYMLNSFVVTIISVLLICFVASLASYGLSRFQFPFREVIFYSILGGLMVSEYCIIIPLYNMFAAAGLRNTHIALYIAYVTLQTPFSVFLMRSYFLSVPKDIEEAAFIDGCSILGIFFRIVVPICRPIIFSCAIVSAVSVWNEFMFAMVFIDSQSLMTVPLGLQTFQGQYASRWCITLAACVISSLPLLLTFLLAQKQFVRGLAAGSVKE